MSNCKCKKPSDIHNGVCGKCLLPLQGIVHGEGGQIIEDKSDWKMRRQEALDTAEPNKHAWFQFKNDKFYSCAKCGYIKNANNENNLCKGPVKITFRKEYSQAIYYSPEFNEIRIAQQNDDYDGDHDPGIFELNPVDNAYELGMEDGRFTFSNEKEANSMNWYKIGIL